MFVENEHCTLHMVIFTATWVYIISCTCTCNVHVILQYACTVHIYFAWLHLHVHVCTLYILLSVYVNCPSTEPTPVTVMGGHAYPSAPGTLYIVLYVQMNMFLCILHKLHGQECRRWMGVWRRTIRRGETRTVVHPGAELTGSRSRTRLTKRIA